ncbi:hypothetical protein GA0116948_11739 [Chitinophaga costaii]|uniref:Lipoprotein n=1 Tax=Chitinophaga costaii TaxID=1335309 RepID=A0A1C4FUT5_9BACT|nr:hypothetical protein [Chitinophaga costaii]PUZ27228.1 hypothetical protein DCM91_08420 [Chitinophaga costaii]SCC59634.1 hypothetical protein GA0116948_11739 [Chitinophaga costaii]
MKRVLTAVALLSALTFSACKKTEVTQVVNNATTVLSSIQAGTWDASSDKTEYTASFTVPEIDDDVLQNGAVLAYLSLDNNHQTYDQIPLTYGNYVFAVYHSAGTVTVDVTALAGGTFDPPNFDIPVKIVVVRTN